MGFQIHFRIKNDEFLLHAFPVCTQKMLFAKVDLERIIIDVVLLLPSLLPPVADVTTLVLVAAVHIELVIPVEPLLAEPTVWMALEPALVDRSGVIVTKLFMFPELLCGKEVMLVREYFFVLGAELTHDFVMYASHMSMEIWPVPASNIAISVWAVVA